MDRRAVVYQCPVTQRYYDPSVVLRAYAKCPDDDVPLSVIREALGLPAVDSVTGIGVLEHDVLRAHTAFSEWIEGKDNGVDSGDRSAAPTESLPASVPTNCSHCS